MTRHTTAEIADLLRSWASGMYTYEAAAELLIRFNHGRLLAGPWVEWDDGCRRYWFNTDLVRHSAYLSSGECRVLMIAAAISSDTSTVSLSDAVPGLDRDALALVLAAIAYAGGSHDHSEWTFDDDGKPLGHQRLSSLFPWPEVAA
ncbi:hypothetical protein [Nocardioides albus]|uniref:Uncharacterized protein n=1 Tax=Nocardioides albus TaxID=1841 RepID=A0A7W5FA13_9ACTN|nr:hypothetical protein [Nocardioides albus]MBB3090788.1 hypothetical protein [Nocardioides albus]GGU37490.1 hypothetical protein GCM10007979_40630 [Nocardioides albus]